MKEIEEEVNQVEEKINELMRQYYVTFDELAVRLGVSKQTLTRKFKGATDWTYAEMILLSQIFNLENPTEFFFS